jgi:hypothetical protein
MQLVLSNNRVIAHGENFLAMGGVVINTETGAKFDNATVAECDGCPSDIDKVGYEYVGGVFKPCAPYGAGNNNGFFMEVCETCATPRSSGIPIKGGIKNENLNPEVTALSLGGALFSLLWENPKPTGTFTSTSISLASDDYDLAIVIVRVSGTEAETLIIPNGFFGKTTVETAYGRTFAFNGATVSITYVNNYGGYENYNNPLKIYGVKLGGN